MTPLKVGLTGSIGMGKSTVAKMFAKTGCAVWDADAAVHRLYQPGADGYLAIAKICPDAAGPDGISQEILSKKISQTPEILKKIEDAIHPLVATDRADFIAQARTDIVILDIPLIFETGSADAFDKIVVVSATAEVQRKRVLERPGMTQEKFEMILARQVPDAEKRRKADHVIETDVPLEETEAEVRALVNAWRLAL